MKHLVYLFKLLQTQVIRIKFKNYNKKVVLIAFYNKKDKQGKCTNCVCRSEDDKNDRRMDLKTKHRRLLTDCERSSQDTICSTNKCSNFHASALCSEQ